MKTIQTLPGKLIHIFIMPCARIPLLLEQRGAGRLPFISRLRLRAHLSLCKWCGAYAHKAGQIDRLLSEKFQGKQKKQGFEDSEIQSFKDRAREKINP